MDMDCDRLREVLIDHVDGLLGREDADAARDHLAACGSCRALQEEVRRNFTALDAWEDEELPAGAFGRLESRMTASRAASGAVPAGSAARNARIRAVAPWAAGLATAAAFAWIVVVPRFAGTPGAPAAPLVVEPAADPDSGLDTPAPVARFSEPVGGPVADRPARRSGEHPLEFRDADNGLLVRFRLPPGVDPGKVQLVDTRPRILPDDEGVR